MEELLNYEGLVYHIITKYSHHYDREDLYQVGMIGLMDAYRHYKKDFSTKFSTFAYYYIVGEIHKYIRESSSLKVGRDIVELKKKLLKAKEVMAQRLGREPTNLELSLFLDIEEKEVDMALLATEEVHPLEEVEEFYQTFDDTSPEILDLKLELDKLPKEEKELIQARYFEDLTQKEVSSRMGISQVQVSRQESKILQKLRSRL